MCLGHEDWLCVCIVYIVVLWCVCVCVQKVYQEMVRSEGMIEHLVRGLKKENRELQMHCAAAIFKVCTTDCMYYS